MDAVLPWTRPVSLAMLRAQLGEVGAVEPATRSTSFEGLYRDHYRDLYRYVLLRLGRPSDAEDLVADTFDRAFVAWRDGRGPAGRALPWLIVIARRIIVDRSRRARLIRWLPFEVDGRERQVADPSDPAARAEFWLWLGQLATVLPERQREAILLRYQRDLTDEDIGEVLGLSASGVRTLVSRALATLREHPEMWS